MGTTAATSHQLAFATGATKDRFRIYYEGELNFEWGCSMPATADFTGLAVVCSDDLSYCCAFGECYGGRPFDGASSKLTVEVTPCGSGPASWAMTMTCPL